MNVWHCLESDVVTKPHDRPRFHAMCVRVPNVTASARVERWWSHRASASVPYHVQPWHTNCLHFNVFVTRREQPLA